jgi:predicted nucleotidyltransferase
MKSIDISPAALQTVTEILSRYASEYEIWAFGSRVKQTAREYSDLDLALITNKPLDLYRMAELREAFSEAELPFKVDIIDWASTDGRFQDIICKDHVLLQRKFKEAH